MRYKETGRVHMDFHRTTNGTIRYLRENYGDEFLDEVLRRTAEDVYRSIHEDLKAGNPEQLIEHWSYYFDREGGGYEIKRDGDTVTMTVSKCPAIAYLGSRKNDVDQAFCRQTVAINEALADGTPFEIATEVLGDGRCVQTIRRRQS